MHSLLHRSFPRSRRISLRDMQGRAKKQGVQCSSYTLCIVLSAIALNNSSRNSEVIHAGYHSFRYLQSIQLMSILHRSILPPRFSKDALMSSRSGTPILALQITQHPVQKNRQARRRTRASARLYRISPLESPKTFLASTFLSHRRTRIANPTHFRG